MNIYSFSDEFVKIASYRLSALGGLTGATLGGLGGAALGAGTGALLGPEGRRWEEAKRGALYSALGGAALGGVGGVLRGRQADRINKWRASGQLLDDLVEIK